MKRVNYEAVRTGQDGEKRCVNLQLPGEGGRLVYAAIQGIGVRMRPGQWIEVKTAALEASATGPTKVFSKGGVPPFPYRT